MVILIFGDLMQKDPIKKVLAWMNLAASAEINDPEAVSLATVDQNGFPNVRTVLLRKI